MKERYVAIVVVILAVLMTVSSVYAKPTGNKADVSIIEDAKLVSKEYTGEEDKMCSTCKRYIVLKKNNEEIRLQIHKRDVYATLKPGSTVNVEFDRQGLILLDIEFPNVETIKQPKFFK